MKTSKTIAIVVSLAIALASCLSFSLPTFADEDSNNQNTIQCHCENGKEGTKPKTAILGKDDDSPIGCECGGGESVGSILNLVVDIMTIGVGILGVIGISITGIQYLTAGGSEEKVRKAKRRMFEIIIGLAVYATLFVLLRWLLPGFGGLAQ